MPSLSTDALCEIDTEFLIDEEIVYCFKSRLSYVIVIEKVKQHGIVTDCCVKERFV